MREVIRWNPQMHSIIEYTQFVSGHSQNNQRSYQQKRETEMADVVNKKLNRNTMPSGIKKQYLKTKGVCKVRFCLPKNAVNGEEKICIVGDFNNWNPSADPLQKLKSGDYTITLNLKPGKEYQYKYFIGGTRWENDWNADKYVRSPYGDSDNSVVII